MCASNFAITAPVVCLAYPVLDHCSMNIMTSNIGTQNPSYLRTNMALALVGRSVSLRANANAIIHGEVKEIQMECGTPRLLVCGGTYDLEQVLTSAPLRCLG
jgi:hypothetical protein